MNLARTPANKGEKGKPRLRCKLRTVDDVCFELARLYREGKAGARDVADVSKLANVLALLGRLISDSSLEARIEKLEELNAEI